MKNTIILVLIILCSAIAFTCFSGCIESSFAKTETVLIKLDRSGSPQWISVFENSGYARARSLAPGTLQGIQTSDGFFLAGFFTNTTGAGYIRILKTDTSGKLIHETMLPARGDQILLITWHEDTGYLVITRLGQVYAFSPQGDFRNTWDISNQINQHSARQPAAPEALPVTLVSVTRSGTGDFTALVQNHAEIYHPLQVIRFSANGTVLETTIPEQAEISQATSVFPVRDRGFILGKSVYRDEPGGGKQVMLERTDASGVKIWNTTLGVCNYVFCTNDLVGLSESEAGGFEIVFQSHEQSNSSSSPPVTTIHARLDNEGQVVGQEIVSDVSALPSWVFRTGSSSDFRDIINERALEELTSGMTPGKSGIQSVSVLGTSDGGYALIATRYDE